MASSEQARTVRYDATFDRQLKELLKRSDTWRLNDVLRGVEWAIATNPRAHPRVDTTDIRIVKTDHYDGAPPMRIYFSIDADDHHCSVFEIHEAEHYEEEDET